MTPADLAGVRRLIVNVRVSLQSLVFALGLLEERLAEFTREADGKTQ